MSCFRILVAYNVHNMNVNIRQGVGDRALVVFDTARVTVECLLIPAFWLLSSWQNFPDLWSSGNTFLGLSQGQNKPAHKEGKVKRKKQVLVPRKPLIQVRICHKPNIKADEMKDRPKTRVAGSTT